MKNILVISNNIFSKSDSNGRTLGNMFKNYPKCNIAQFCINVNGDIDFDICNNYFYISDVQVLKSLFKKQKSGTIIKEQNNKKNNIKSRKKMHIKRNAFTMLIRNHIWSKMKWCDSKLYDWVSKFKPDCILLQGGDLPFTFDFAVYLSEKYNIPYYLFNTEGYYFKNYDYFQKRKLKSSLFYNLFHSKYKKSYDHFMKNVKGCIYVTEELKNEYNKVFKNYNSIVIMASTSINIKKNAMKNKSNLNPLIVYAGNLSLNRHKNLIEIADKLAEINPKYKLTIYGKTSDNAVLKLLENHKNIIYKGFVNYNDLIKVLVTSDLIIHTESFDPFYIEDLKFAFSTKIADCLSIGKPFLFYGSEKLNCTKYLEKNDCAFVVKNKKNLSEMLSKLLNNELITSKKINNGEKTVKNNHNIDLNSNRFIDFINKS